MPDEPKSIHTDDEAAALYKATKSDDPFPDIAPALLNSADIDDYIRATGMIFPYETECLKSASYEGEIGNHAVYWDKDGERHDDDLRLEKTVTIQPNSLIYLTTRQKFRLPDYMAIRFNLRIKNVHRGLLLGTGPLVDPGFEGHLVIPLHNFTTNPYQFEIGERFIWIEFTKISPNKKWVEILEGPNSTIAKRIGQYREFPPAKKDKNIEYYHMKAAANKPLKNVIPQEIKDAKASAEKARKTVATIRNWGIGAGLATIIFGIVPMAYSYWSLGVDTSDLISETRSQLEQSKFAVEAVEKKLSTLGELKIEIAKLNRQDQELRDQIEAIQKRTDKEPSAPAEQGQ